jgi:type VI secretion system secreted protein VgrG
MQREAVSALLIRGLSTCGAFAPDRRFKITDQVNAKGDYLLVSVTHTASEGTRYENGFTAIPFDAQFPFRPPRLAVSPFIAGVQTATVVGFDPKKAPKEEMLTDKFGRVKVRFNWNQEHDPDIDCSCWVRVSQVSAGNRWGASFWPRIGQEVVVAFLEGNPDQPILVGTVYNALQMPPYLGDGLDRKHPNDNKISGIKTNTTLGGEVYNELRFDDTKDKQQVSVVPNSAEERPVGSV